MKYLRQFTHFDLASFLADKTLTVVGISDLMDHDTKAIIGKRVTCAITRDDTAYLPGKDGSAPPVSNIYEKLAIKVRYPNTVSASIGDEVTLTNATATVYGDFQNQLSITAEGVEAKHASANKDKG